MRIYEVFDFEPNNIREMKENNQKLMEEAFSYYQAGEFLKANEIYKQLEIRNEELEIEENKSKIPHSSSLIPNSNVDSVLHFFSERCRNLQIRKEAGLLKDWNGVFEFMDK